jgi:hypothetical protein
MPRVVLLAGPVTLILLGNAAIPAAEKPNNKQIACLLVNGRPAKESLKKATIYLDVAVNPLGENEDLGGGLRIRKRVIERKAFGDLDQASLQNWSCIFLCDVPRFSDAEIKRLEGYVRGGGGVIICLGPGVDVNAYNDQLYRKGKGLLPVRLRKEPKQGRFAFTSTREALKQPPLAIFDNELFQQSLRQPRIKKYLAMERPAAEAKVRVLLSFEEVDKKGARTGPGRIAMLEWRPFPESKRSGRVVLVTTSFDTEWGNLPLKTVFVPLVQGLVRFVALDSATQRAPITPESKEKQRDREAPLSAPFSLGAPLRAAHGR